MCHTAFTLQLVGKALPNISLLRARLVCKHWAQTLCSMVDQLNIVPEAFGDSGSAAKLYVVYPWVNKAILDLQDTYTLVSAVLRARCDFRTGMRLSWLLSLRISACINWPLSSCSLMLCTSSKPIAVLPLRLQVPPADTPVATPDDVAAKLPAGLVVDNISTEPIPGLLLPQCTHLQIRLPDTTETTAHDPDVPTSWVYIDNLLSLHGQHLQSLHMTTAPGPQITVLSMLTQLTLLTMDEASHTVWSNEHIPIIGTLTNLKTLTLKIPQYRPEQSRTASGLNLLSSWTALTKLTKLHVCVMRYTYHASLVAILPQLKQLESLAIRAPQTRLPWPGSDRPLFDNIGTLTGLTSLSLALVDHHMQAVHWQALLPLTALTSLELSVSEQADSLNVPQGKHQCLCC